MVKLRQKLYALAILWCLHLVPLSVHASDIIISTDRNPVSMNESFQLVYQTSDSVDGDPDFSPLEPYLDIINRSQNSNVSIINGNYTSSRSWRLTVMPRQEGDITLPSIKFGSNTSPVYQLKVKPAQDKPIAQSSLFARMEASSKEAYVQQQIIVTQQLFSDKNVSAYAMGELKTQGMDALIEPVSEEKQYKMRLSNRDYLVIERKYAVYPQSSGALKINPVLVEARTGSAVNSIFGSISSRGMVMRVRSNGLDVKVLPVPANANMDPWLPATKIQLLEQWAQNPPRFVQGEPLTRTLSIKAEGLTAAQLPEMPVVNLDEVKQYPDQPLLNDVKNESGISGYRLEKVAFVPMKAGRVTLPAIEIPWWNTTTGTREVARIPERSIEVIAAMAAAPAPAATQPMEALSQAPEPELTEVTTEPADRFNAWIVVSAILGLGWLLSMLAWYASSRRAASVNRSRDGANTASGQMLKQLENACSQKDAAACRASLLDWAKAHYPQRNIVILSDLYAIASDDLIAQIRNLDAVLYGGQQREVDFAVIRQQVRELMKQKTPRDSSGFVLEPLYK